ncbi:Aste57867_4276 [Aphanomyces stellatus]|uniref:Aste57867_4276 protein n=1 Tax=Aphanomyces stellatus TaxID=120398 RepID=A0A485KF62_9STRA|nr:hypothetical protein As57867_004265 [Aphanomyces stellatus]VFT81391.1 Aste57867_4276 [Aphanomyces stellatus]
MVYGAAVPRIAWDYLVPVVQANLNQTPVASLENRSPLECFSAREPITILDMASDAAGVPVNVKVDWSKASIQKTLLRMHASMRHLHKTILDKNEARQLKAINKTFDYDAINADVCDYMLL